MQHNLSYNWRNFKVVNFCARIKNSLKKTFSKSSIWSSHTIEPLNLSLIIWASSARVKSAIPLKPPIWIRISHPTSAFPHSKTATTLYPIFVYFYSVNFRSKHFITETFYPFRLNCVSEHFFWNISDICNSTCDWSKICSTKRPSSQNFFWSCVWDEVRIVIKNQITVWSSSRKWLFIFVYFNQIWEIWW